jgi:hypothetical protein
MMEDVVKTADLFSKQKKDTIGDLTKSAERKVAKRI